MLGELVELVHVDVYEYLGGKVSKRQPNTLLYGKASHDLRKERKDILIGNVSPQDLEKNAMVDGCEKLADIALQDPRGSGVIFRYDIGELTKLLHGLMGSFSYPA